MELLDNLRIVLVEPTHPGNIGAVARSMKTMGLSQLCLVNPRKFPHCEATKRAAGADSVLQNAEIVGDLRSAIEDCTLVLGTSVRDREVNWPTQDPRRAAEQIIEHLASAPAKGVAMPQPGQQPQAAILFGRESSGLSNHELDLCNCQIRIAANPEYSSLNLASAVQIISYELRMVALQLAAGAQAGDSEALTAAKLRQQDATVAQREGHLGHLQQTLEQLDFIKSKPPTMLMRKLTRLYNKAQLSNEEIQILRGILTAIQTQLHRSGKP